MAIASPKSTLTGLVMYSLDLVRQYPRNPLHFPYDVTRVSVELKVEFDDEEAAKRFEDKVRKLLEHDDMQVSLRSKTQ